MFRKKRIKTPTLIQLEMAECGAASLGIMLRHFGRFVPLAELREACGISRDGSKASNLVIAAKRYGLEARGLSCDLEKLRELPCPYIVFWKFNHFLVVEGFNRDWVYLNDPANGHRRITWAEFDDDFTGIVLAMKPGPEFEKNGNAQTVLPSLVGRLRGHWSTLLFCLLAGLLLALPGLTLPACAAVFVDSIVIDGRSGWIRPLLVVMATALSLQVVLKLFQLFYLRQLGIALAARLSGQFFWHLLKLPMSFYAQRFPGEIANRGLLNEKVAHVLASRLSSTVIEVLTMAAYVIVLLFYDVTLTLIGVTFAGCNFLALNWLSRHRVEANTLMAQEEGKAASSAISCLQSIETFKASGLETGWFGQWSGYYAKACNARQRLEASSVTLGVLPSFLQATANALILLLATFRVMQGEMSIGMMVAFQALMASFLAPIGSLVNFGGTLQELHGDLGRLNDVLENETSEQLDLATSTQSMDHEQTRLAGRVEIKGVTFGYSKLEAPLIEEFDTQVDPGQWLAIVGPSGSGKSTVAKLLSGLYQPWSGAIHFDGVAREEITQTVLVNSVGVVDQELMLFEGTVRENLTLWDPLVKEEAILRACRDAMIHEHIMALPGGYNANLMEGGINLSGGQRQRLEIARALIHDPTLLILDEATSALDAETEHAINKNLRLRGCTCIVVAHRSSTIQACDQIVMLDQGKIVAQGAHDELLVAQRSFAALVQKHTLTPNAELAKSSCCWSTGFSLPNTGCSGAG